MSLQTVSLLLPQLIAIEEKTFSVNNVLNFVSIEVVVDLTW